MLVDFRNGGRRSSISSFPNLGRFVEADPIGYEGGLNLYAYVGNDPINWTDPLGLRGGCSPQATVCADYCRTYPHNCDLNTGPGQAPALPPEVARRDPVEGELIVVRAPRNEKLSQCVINFLTSQGYGSPNLPHITFVEGNPRGRWDVDVAFRGHGAMTVGNNIYVRQDRWNSITSPIAGPVYFEEIIHSIQYHVSGQFNFYVTYGRNALASLLMAGSLGDNPAEAQAIGISIQLQSKYERYQRYYC